MQTKNLTIMFTDMKGFTQRTSVGSRKQVERLLDSHNEIVRPIFRTFGGSVIKTIGDAFLVVFESPTDAVLCGTKIQESVVNHNATVTSDERFEIRIAINSGEVHLKDGDVFGEPVNVAARIQSIAEPGEVYFTEAVYLTMNKNEIPSSEVGQRHLKGIPEQVKVYKVLQERTNLMRSQQKRRDLAAKTADLDKEGENLASKATASAAPVVHAKSSATGKIIVAVVITLLAVGLVLAILIIGRNKKQAAQPTVNQPATSRAPLLQNLPIIKNAVQNRLPVKPKP